MTSTPNSRASQTGHWLQAGRLAFIAVYGVALLAAVGWASNNVRQIKPDQQMVVLRMSVLDRIQQAGLLLAWPAPFERVVTLPAGEAVIERHVATLLRSAHAKQADMDAEDDDEGEPVGDALAGSGYLLTGDTGLVQLDVHVYYKVIDPFEYVLQGEHIDAALDRLVSHSAVSLCAARDLDTILVARPEFAGAAENAERRAQLRSDLVISINRSLHALTIRHAGLGIAVVRIDVESKLPEPAVSSFNAVLTAIQRAEQGVADARTEAARITQAATQAADRTVQLAQANASERLARAQTDTSTINHLAQALKSGVEPGILMRVYRERMPGILARANSVTLINPKDNAHLIIQGADK